MGAVWAVVKKDLREVLSSPYFIASLIGGLIALIVLGAVMGESIRATKTSLEEFAIVVNNTTQLGWMFVEELSKRGGEVYREFSAELLERYGFVVFVPANFSFPAVVELAAKYRGVFILAPPPMLDEAAQAVAERVGIPPRLVELSVYVYLDGKRLSAEEVNALLSVFIFSWLFILIVPAMVASTAAISVGLEKEKKMFELILSTPATATSVVAAKFVSTLILTLIQYAVLAAGFVYYMTSVVVPPSRSIDASLSSQALLDPSVISPSLTSALALSIVVLSISFLVAVKTEDIKTAQSVVPVVVLPMILPSIAALFVPLDTVEWYPFAHPLAIAASLLTGQAQKVATYLLIDAALATAAAVLALRLATPQYIVLGRRRR